MELEAEQKRVLELDEQLAQSQEAFARVSGQLASLEKDLQVGEPVVPLCLSPSSTAHPPVALVWGWRGVLHLSHHLNLSKRNRLAHVAVARLFQAVPLRLKYSLLPFVESYSDFYHPGCIPRIKQCAWNTVSTRHPERCILSRIIL